MWGSKLIGNYAAGLKYGAAGLSGLAGRAGFSSGYAAGSFMRRHPQAMSMVAGGAYGAVSDDTSILGGAFMGGAAMRYGGSGLRRGLLGRRGIGVPNPGMGGAIRGFGKGVRNRAIMDARGARLMANQGFQKVGSTLKNWM